MGRKKAVGFEGWASYETSAQDEWNKATVTLARFAEYSNIGGNRKGGFGETRFYPTPDWKSGDQGLSEVLGSYVRALEAL